MRYFKRMENGEVTAFGTGGTDGIEISAEEYAALLAAHTAKLQAERAERIYSEPAEEAAGISMEERLAALEAAVLEMALEVEG